MKEQTPKRSWGREVGLCMLVLIFYLAIVESSSLSIVIWPFITFIFWAFGVVKNADNLSTIIGSLRK